MKSVLKFIYRDFVGFVSLLGTGQVLFLLLMMVASSNLLEHANLTLFLRWTLHLAGVYLPGFGIFLIFLAKYCNAYRQSNRILRKLDMILDINPSHP